MLAIKIYPQVFTEDGEEALVEYLVKCSNFYYRLSITELKELAYEFAKKTNAKYPNSWNDNNMAGWQWYYGFMKRHSKLSLRTPEQTSLHRIRAFCKENVEHFFKNLGTIYTLYEPHRIFNMDLTGFSNVPTKIGKVISLKGMKRVGKVAAQNVAT